jgi:RNA polymerase sigma-70 factor, ECF subfamily
MGGVDEGLEKRGWRRDAEYPLELVRGLSVMTANNLSAVAQSIRGPFQQFTLEFEPLRPELYRYCRYLTRTPWDAEDLVQDTLVRAFMLLGASHAVPVHPKAWLFRVASNRWLNLCKGRREDPRVDVPGATYTPADPKATREAAGSLVVGLAPQERAALVLKEVFEFSLEEISEMLVTTVGGVKSALTRARGKVNEPSWSGQEVAPPAVLNEFCSAFNARDLDKVVSLLLETVEVELSGTFADSGVDVAKRSFGGLMFATKMAMEAGIASDYRGSILAAPPRFELRMHRGAPIILTFWKHDDGEHVRGVSLIAAEGDQITRITTYMHSPELLAEVCRELGETFRSNGYRNWEPQASSVG